MFQVSSVCGITANLFLVAGKDGTCTRHAFGDNGDIAGMIKGMMENSEDIENLINEVVKE